MLDKEFIVELLRNLEIVLIVVIPALFAMYKKIKKEIESQSTKLSRSIHNKNVDAFHEWQHKESIIVLNKLNEICNYYCDISKVHTSFIQLENGTLATTKISNMYFSCCAEDDRYSNAAKFIDKIQRVPYVRLSRWFNYVTDNSTETRNIVYVDKLSLDDLLWLDCSVENIVSGLVRNPRGVIVGVCNFIFNSEDKDINSKEQIHDTITQMNKFISGIETTFLNYETAVKHKLDELELDAEDINNDDDNKN